MFQRNKQSLIRALVFVSFQQFINVEVFRDFGFHIYLYFRVFHYRRLQLQGYWVILLVLF